MMSSEGRDTFRKVEVKHVDRTKGVGAQMLSLSTSASKNRSGALRWAEHQDHRNSMEHTDIGKMLPSDVSSGLEVT